MGDIWGGPAQRAQPGQPLRVGKPQVNQDAVVDIRTRSEQFHCRGERASPDELYWTDDRGRIGEVLRDEQRITVVVLDQQQAKERGGKGWRAHQRWVLLVNQSGRASATLNPPGGMWRPVQRRLLD